MDADRPTFRILGTVEAIVDGRAIELGRRQERCLLGLLLLDVNRPVPVDRLIELIWEQPGPRARATLRTYVTRLRSCLLPTALGVRRDGSGYVIDVDPYRVDLHRFRGEVVRASGIADPRQRADVLRGALALWRGPLLSGVAEDAVLARISPSEEQGRVRATELWAEAELACGSHADVVEPLRRLLDDEPFRELAARLLMLAHYRAGRQVQSLAVFRTIRAAMAEQLGIEPGAELRRLHEAILRGEDHLVDPPNPAVTTGGLPAAPRELPRDIPAFVGRAQALRTLDGYLHESGPVIISAIDGTAGVGKTALAVHWAHRMAGQFADGQLHVDLRGYSGGAPTRPVDALAGFLRALGLSNSQIPVDVAEAAARYRSLMAGRRMVVVLDNAGSADQVRPLLPGDPNCLVLVTSRDRLSGLVARDGARQVTLDVLEPAEAVDLLAGIIGRVRAADEPDAVAELASLCAFLPLALRIAAAHVADRPEWTVGEHVADLAARDPIAALAIPDDEASAVQIAFDRSYRALPAAARVMFRRIGLVPLPDLTPATAAALASCSPPEATTLLNRLADAHMLDQNTSGRYKMHDLLRRFAGNLADTEENPAQRSTAVARLHRHLAAKVDAGAALIAPEMLRLPTDRDGRERFTSPESAMAWLDTNLANVRATVIHAASQTPHVAWELTDALRGYLWLSNNTIDWLRLTQVALTAAEQAGNLCAQAAMRLSTALARQVTGENDMAITENELAVELCRAAGWTRGEAAALGNLGIAYAESGRPREAIARYELALDLHQRSGRAIGEALTLANLGNLYRDSGQLTRAVGHFENALRIYRAEGSGATEAYSLCALGDVYRQLGRLDEAESHVNDALALSRKLHSHDGTIMALHSLAGIHRDRGDYRTALRHARSAMTISEQNPGNYSSAMVHIMLASITVHIASNVDEATRLYTTAIDLAKATGGGYPYVAALLGLATLELGRANLPAATAHATHALELAGKAGYQGLDADARTVLAEIQLRQAD